MSSLSVYRCRNCDAMLNAGQAFCGTCGQKVTAGRLTMREIGLDFMHALAHMDHSVFSLVRVLFIRPGYVAREYVVGKRKRYFGPFAFLVIVVGLASAAMALSGTQAFTSDNPNALADFLQRHVNVIILLEVPLLAAFCGILFRKAGLNFAEHLVLASYASGMRALFLTLVVVPFWYLMHPGNTTVILFYYAYSLLWLVFFGFAASQFYPAHRGLSFFKGMLAAVLTLATVQAVVSLISYFFFLVDARS